MDNESDVTESSSLIELDDAPEYTTTTKEEAHVFLADGAATGILLARAGPRHCVKCAPPLPPSARKCTQTLASRQGLLTSSYGTWFCRI